MKAKSYSIGILAISALILFIAQFLPVQPVAAQESVKDRDYSMVTARSQRGGDTVYVVDNRTGQVAVFVWDPAQRGLAFAGVGPLSDAFKD